MGGGNSRKGSVTGRSRHRVLPVTYRRVPIRHFRVPRCRGNATRARLAGGRCQGNQCGFPARRDRKEKRAATGRETRGA
ncbi:hypothetical protein NDU88_008054 [Pleurodeles waltl]|uniref:Uncharacterized protein n=1 Tax=Pleurodeles waltl TaxID=8319 RepID=A0AAV7RR86_PLEWA|nr:hypothetical protein NDU88_008054 [Pleurodeles waltl]